METSLMPIHGGAALMGGRPGTIQAGAQLGCDTNDRGSVLLECSRLYLFLPGGLPSHSPYCKPGVAVAKYLYTV